MNKLLVIALGGNALKKANEAGTEEDLNRNITNACKQIVQIIKQGYRVVITHGNGPQVGNRLIQQEMAKNLIPPLPLDILVSMTQGQLGYLLQRTLINQLAKEGLDTPVVTCVTQVLVNQHDPGFKNPSKPIGPFYTKEEAQEHAKSKKYIVKEVKPGTSKSWRRIVPSPEPVEIVEKKILKRLVESGALIIASGGGGIPVIKMLDGSFKGVEAVIDKDLAAEKLAEALNANILLILTDVEKVKLNFGKANESDLDEMNLDEAKKYISQGHFLDGSMGPKVAACVRFLEWGGEKAIITSLEKASEALGGKTGTPIYRTTINSDDISLLEPDG